MTMGPVGVAVTGTVPRVHDLPVSPCRGLCAAACAHHPAALPLGLWAGLLQDGAAVSRQAKAFPILTTCSGCRERPGWDSLSMWLPLVGAYGRPSFYSGSVPSAKASEGWARLSKCAPWECLGALGMAREVPGAQSWATE